MISINPNEYRKIVFFTGAGMSAESGAPTYRGSGGIWEKYNWEECACQEAFNRNPKKVLEFHELGRKAFLECKPHAGHLVIAELEKQHPDVFVVTQNIDGMHQRAGNKNVIELHGSIWRLGCMKHGVIEDMSENYSSYTCKECSNWLRPDIVWFGDMLDQDVMMNATSVIEQCDLFICIGTSGVVWPAAGLAEIAVKNKARCIEINLESAEMSYIYNEVYREPAGKVLPKLFGFDRNGINNL